MCTPSRGWMLRRAASLLILWFSAILGAVPACGAAEAFRPTGSLTMARQDHTATLLANGKVLVAGGNGQANGLNSAELYDPASGSWTPTGNMITGRASHTATLLPSGKVLVAGGSGFSAALASAELYDPATGTWSATGGLPVAVKFHRATLLTTGRVLLTGGTNASSVPQAGALLYDPATGGWTATSSLNTARYFHSATLLSNGKLLVVGGSSGIAGYAASAELYDPETGAWTVTGSLAEARGGHAAALLANGKVVIAGGSYITAGQTVDARSSAELYDADAGSWSATGAPSPFAGDSTVFSALLPDDRLLVTEGNSGAVYDPLSGTWLADVALHTPRVKHTATLLPGGEVLVVGGHPAAGSGSALASAELYTSVQPGWFATGTLVSPRQHDTATLLADGRVLAAGGNEEPSGTCAELYDPAANSWTATGNFALPRDAHTATLLPDGKVLAVGGRSGGAVVETVELYDPSTGEWTAALALAEARAWHTATLLANGLVLVTGGSTGPAALASCALFDPATGLWTPTGSLATGRDRHTAVLLADGRVLVAGGRDGSGVPLTGAELYDPAAGTWSGTGSLGTARYLHTASLLPSGQVLVAGGAKLAPLKSAELYDPATGRWTATGDLGTARSDHTATVLPNGGVAVAGGVNGDGWLAATEVYHPSSGTWKAGASLAGARAFHTATLLPNAQLLVAGGFGPSAADGDSLLDSAELFDFSGPLEEAPKPQLSSAALQSQNGTAVVISGSNLLGSTVVVQLRNLANGQILYAHPGGTAPTSTTYLSGPISGLAPGFFLVTVLVDGVAGNSVILQSTVLTATIVALPATEVTPVSARLRAQVAANGGPATVAFAYSIDPALLQNVTSTAMAGTVAAGSISTVTQRVIKLTSATTYYFRAVATTASGVFTGEIVSFTTADPIPTDATPPYATIAPTGNLAVPRSSQSAVLLPGGKVLLAGGSGVGGALASAEIYDPATGLSHAAASMLNAHSAPTMTLLPNGRVLVIGSGGPATAGAELYDPVPGTWSSTNAGAAVNPTATLLGTGKVLLAGGVVGGAVTKTASLYDPASGATTALPSMTVARLGSTATLMANGKVLLAGNGLVAELFDSATGAWATTGSMKQSRSGHAAVLLPDGRVLVLGGSGATCEFYDPASGTWTATGSLNVARSGATATVLPNGKVWVAGGNGGSSATELYDPNTGRWTLVDSLAAARFNSTATLLADGTVYVASDSTAEIYSPAKGASQTQAAPAVARGAHTATLLPSGKLLLAGGTSDVSGAPVAMASAELYNPANASWTPTGDLTAARSRHTATLLPTGQVLVAGGFDGTGLATSELYDSAIQAWSTAGNLAAARYEHTATLLANGKVLVAGGANAGGPLGTAELYDSATGNWTSTGSLATPRHYHTATVLPGGGVLVAGGLDAAGHALLSAEVYEPASGTWRAVGEMVTARANHGAVLLSDGRVLAAGGRGDPGLLAAAEVYDPATEMWMPTRNLYEARAFHTATLLVDGRVLVAEGLVAADPPEAGLQPGGEIYDPASGTWAAAGSLAYGRTGHTASLLLNGQVLLVGGERSDAAGSAEFYDTGLGFSPSRQAQLLGTGLSFSNGWVLTLSGNRLFGPRGAGSSTPRDSHSPFPVVRLRNLATDEVRTLSPSVTSVPSATSWTSLRSSGLYLGSYAVTLFTNGIPSNSLVLQVPTSEPSVLTKAATGVTARGATFQAEASANGVTTALRFTSATDAALTQNVVVSTSPPLAASSTNVAVARAVTGLLPHRTYYYQATATNSVGSVDGGIVAFTTENTAPIAPPGAADATTGDALTLTLPYAGTDADGDTLTLLSASGDHLTANSFSGNQVTFTPDAGFVGTATLTYQISDGTGLANGTASGLITVTISDNDAPDTNIISAPSGVLATRAASITFGGSDNIGVTSFQGRLDGAAFAPVTSPVNLIGLADGAHNYDVRALDASGNFDPTPGRASWSVDASAPPFDDTPPVLHLPADFTVEATSGAGALVTYTASATDAGSGVAGSSFTPASGSQFSLGTTVVQATATDVAGNVSTGSFRITVRDTTPPVLVLTGANPLQVPLHGTYEDPGATATDAVDGSVAVTVTGAVDVDTSGNYLVSYLATDSTGHSATAKRTVFVGQAPPVAVDDHYFSGSAKRTPLTLHVLDNDTFVHPALVILASVTRPIYGAAVVAGDGRSITYTPGVSFANFAGAESFSYTVRDEFGATATAKVTISNDAYREKGLYDGLLLDDDARAIGYVQVNLTGTGLFTGTLKAGVVSSPLRGQFDTDHHASVALSGASLELQFDGQANMAATYVNGALTGQGTLTHVTYSAANNPAPQEGSYTVLLPPAPAPAGTAAIGAVVVNAFTHKVIGLDVGAGGSGYETPPMVTIVSPAGSGATATAALTAGAVTTLSVLTPGLRYPDTGVDVLIDPPGANLPAGLGYATMKVSQAGAVTLSGKFGDGTILSASGWLKEDHKMALYVIVSYRPGPAGTLSGLLRFHEVEDVSDLDGELVWTKPPQREAALYRSGFETSSHLIGSHYRRAIGAPSLIFADPVTGTATFTTSAGDLINPMQDTVSVSNANVVRKTSVGADRLVLSIVPTTGLFHGTFVGLLPTGTTTSQAVSASFSGVLFQKQNLGEGLFTGPRHTGAVMLTPQ